MTVYVLKEISILDSGERGFYVTVFKDRKSVLEGVEETLEDLIGEEQNYSIGYRDESEIQLWDKDNNFYKIQIEEHKVI